MNLTFIVDYDMLILEFMCLSEEECQRAKERENEKKIN